MLKKISCFILIFMMLTGCVKTGSSETTPSSLPGSDSAAEITEPLPIIRDDLEVHFIYVGQGDSILVLSPSLNILIDGGVQDSGAYEYLQSLNIGKLDMVISTHPHDDHIGGLIKILENIPVAEVLDLGLTHTTETFEDYLSLIDEKDIRFTAARAGMSYDLGGGAVMDIFHPADPSEGSFNDASIVVKITYGSISFLLTGDAGTDAEYEMQKSGYDLKSNILKIGHHGSAYSTSDDFLSAVDPEIAVISCSSDNPYGYPHDETLEKLSDSGIDLYRTDRNGTIVISTDGQTYEIKTEK